MPHVKILKTTMAGGNLVKAGKIVEVSKRDAAILYQVGKAEPASASKKGEEDQPEEMKSAEAEKGTETGKKK